MMRCLKKSLRLFERNYLPVNSFFVTLSLEKKRDIFFMINTYKYILVLLLAAGLVSSCKKNTPKDIGLPLLPGDDLLYGMYTDTLTLITHTVKDDSLRTDDMGPVLMGTINDPIFGTTRSSLFTQFSLSGLNPNFGKNPVLDSAVISLAVYNKQSYGNIKTPQKFDVYEISEDLYRDSIYYSNKPAKYYTTQMIGTATFIPNLKDSVKVDTMKFPPHLRIKLNKTMFQNFLTDSAYKASYGSVTSFQSKFKGVYIKSSANPSVGEGGLVYIDPSSGFSRLTLFYKNDSLDSLYYPFPILKSFTTHYTQFQHDYFSATAITQQLNTPTNIQQSRVYVQPMAGVRTKITMPSLTKMFAGKKVAINKAELVIPIDPTFVDSTYPNASKLMLFIADSAYKGTMVLPPDYIEGGTYFGGEYNTQKKEYRFNIARYVQQVLNKTLKNEGLYISSNALNSEYRRFIALYGNREVLMGGDKNNPKRMYLRITYTPVD